MASYAGVGIGLATLLRASPVRLLQGERPIPRDLLTEGFDYHGLLQAQADESENTDDSESTESSSSLVWKNAVAQVALAASENIMHARNLQGNVPKQARPCLLPVLPAILYLSQLEKANYDVFQLYKRQLMNDARSRITLLWWMSRTWLTGVF